MSSGPTLALRLDTEDFLTPESDLALEAILDILDRHGATATFPLVGAKLRSWQARRRWDLVRRLAGHAVGYHSDTHSVHPTIAEELAGLSWEAACAAFAAREARGFAEVAAACGPPACWTQPGGNWTAAALAVVRRWGVPLDFSEAWNSYLDIGGVPVRYLGLLHWSPPVRAPKPLLSALPAALPQALAQVRAALAQWRRGDPPVCVVAHPTELCTTAFWDVVNFGGGRQPPPGQWRPAPLRAAADVAAAAAAFDRYIGSLARDGVRFVDARTLVGEYPDRAPGTRLGPDALRALAQALQAEAASVRSGNLALSAAEAFGLLTEALAAEADGTDLREVEVRPWDGPSEPPPAAVAAGTVPRAALREAARWCRLWLQATGRLPSAVPVGAAAVPPADFLCAAATALARPEQAEIGLVPRRLRAERFVKPAELLHWDWPVFPPGFRPTRLREQALLQAWTLKAAPPAAAPAPDGRWIADPT